MTTFTIPASLPATPSNTNRASTDATTDSDASSPSFSSVLNSQQPSKAAPETPAPVDGKQTNETKDQTHATPEVAEDATDDALAQSPDEQGLSLPQIALTIAAEAALAIAARQAAPVNTAKADAPLPAAAGLTRQDLPALLAEKTNTDTAQAKTIPAANTPIASLSQTALPDLEARIVAHSKPITLPAGFVPVQAAPIAPHQTELNARKPAAPATTKPAIAPDLLRAGEPSLGKGAAPDLSAGIAALASKATVVNTVQTDLSAAQAGAIATSSTAGAQTSLLSGNVGSQVGTGTQFALPGIATPLQNPQWASDFGRQFISLAKGGHNMPHTAELRLDPPELGPLRISINISDNVAHAIFTSPHAAVRQTVENSLPQLQQLLAQAGISLGQTSVNDQGQQESTFSESFGGGRKSAIAAAGGPAGGVEATAASATRSRAPDALVDTFA